MGVFTACVVGIIRDTLAGEPSILMRPELYVTAAALAAALYVGLRLLGLPSFEVAIIAAAAGFGLRGAALHWNLALPAYPGLPHDHSLRTTPTSLNGLGTTVGTHDTFSSHCPRPTPIQLPGWLP